MNTHLTLGQQTFTSHRGFETARSEDVSLEERRELEQRSVYPRGWQPPSPLILRAFPLASGEGDFAVAFARYLEADATGREGNFVVRSYIVRQPDFDRIGGNLAWLVTQLAGPASPPPAAGPTLPRAEVVCDFSRVFDCARFLVADLSPDRVEQILTQLLLNLAAANGNADGAPPMTLTFGGRPDEALCREWSDCVDPSSGGRRQLPALDVLNGWRMAGLLAMVPRILKERASFSINEVSTISAYRQVILRDGIPVVARALNVHPFVERCVAWAECGDVERLEHFVNWVSDVLPHPSLAALADLTAFYADVVMPIGAGGVCDWPLASRRMHVLPQHAPLHCQRVLAAAKACLTAAPIEHQCDLLLAASLLVSESGDDPDDDLVKTAFGLVLSALPVRTRLDLVSRLPTAVQERLWQRIDDRRAVIADPTNQWSDEGWWLILSLAACVYGQEGMSLAPSPPSWLVQALADRARRRAASHTDVLAEYLALLARAPIRFDGLNLRLIEYVRESLRLGPRGNEVDLLTRFLSMTIGEEGFPDRQVDHAIDLALEVLRACRDGSYGNGGLLAHLVFAWLPRSAASRTITCVRRVSDNVGAERVRVAGRAYQELLAIRRNPEAGLWTMRRTKDHRRWVAERRRWMPMLSFGSRGREFPRFDDVAAACFYRNVRQTMREQDPTVALVTGVLYAEDAPRELIRTLLDLARNERDRISHAWRRRHIEIGSRQFSVAELLAQVLVCAHHAGSGRVADAARLIVDMPAYCEPRPRAELAESLSKHDGSIRWLEHKAGIRPGLLQRIGGRS
jgi:hypothetical protein